ncbi:Fic family protein [Leucobacter sp. HY1910]
MMQQGEGDVPSWPALDHEKQVWEGGQFAAVGPAATQLAQRGATYFSAVPPFIAHRVPRVTPEVDNLAREAEQELARFDAECGYRLAAFGPILLRSEAASSSQIENLTASARQIFTAELGGRGARNAAEIVANTRAMMAALELSDSIDVEAIRQMHRVLMYDQPRHTPGEYRGEAVWIGSSAYSPIGATYVAPAENRVPELMQDLAAFCGRSDLPGLVHMSIAHAQFETIHPFSDGNGRTGRALAQAMLRHSGITRTVAVPVSAGLLTDVQGYHSALAAYREGDVGPIVQQFAAASLLAVPNGRMLLEELDAVALQWREATRARQGSAKQKILDYALERPAFTAEMVARALSIAPSNVYRYLKNLRDEGVLAYKVEHKGPAVWRAPAVLETIDAFAARAGRRTLKKEPSTDSARND